MFPIPVSLLDMTGYCGTVLPNLTNGVVMSSGKFEIGTELDVECDAGYSLDNSSTGIVCTAHTRASGVWLGSVRCASNGKSSSILS